MGKGSWQIPSRLRCEAVCETGLKSAYREYPSEDWPGTYKIGERCPSSGTEFINGRRLCWVHARKAERQIKEE